MADDPFEKHNLADAEQTKVQELAMKLVTFRNLEPKPPLIPPVDPKPADFRAPAHWNISAQN